MILPPLSADPCRGDSGVGFGFCFCFVLQKFCEKIYHRLEVGRAAEDLAQSRWVLGDRVFPRGPAPGALEHHRGPVRSAGVPLGALGTYRDVWIGGFDG
jgi:hypothetical protein